MNLAFSMENYPKNVEYLREKFGLGAMASIYDFVEVATNYIKVSEKSEQSHKEKSDGRKQRSVRNN